MSLTRYMRILLMFDLPSQDDYEKKEYRIFHKQLIKNGFVMIQFSVYVKAVNSYSKVKREVDKLKNYIPQNGNIRALAVTEKQWLDMYLILGHRNVNEIYNNSRRYVKI